MIRKYIFGNPFNTEAIVKNVENIVNVIPSKHMEEDIEITGIIGEPATDNTANVYGTVSLKQGFEYTFKMAENDIVYGLGEANRGINKRGFSYISDCDDQPNHTETVRSLYGAHNFIIVEGEKTFGLFFDYPARMTFDIGYTQQDTLKVSCDEANLVLYVIEVEAADDTELTFSENALTEKRDNLTNESSAYNITRQFRKLIGRSYIPPKFAFGFGQSRWGYTSREDFTNVVTEYRKRHIPLDMVYMDIDYMKDYKDFTLSDDFSEDFPEYVQDMKKQHIHLVPIIDAGVKVEKGYSVYEEGIANNYFCKREDGSDFVAAVWPGDTHFPDVLNPEARVWFGDKYKFLLDQGIEGFWNDMNEPAIFYSTEGITELKDELKKFVNQNDKNVSIFELRDKVNGLSNSPKDYAAFYHETPEGRVCHDKVHNLFGYNMTRAAGEAFERLLSDKRILLFSRSSYIGMHRYGGIWTGDNQSWWSHILLNLKMMPSLNMCGFLYTGADLGGFGSDTTRDLLLRWLALGIFTPLMRNHSALGTREQECYRFENAEDFAHVVGVRYRLVPYIYSEYMKAVLNDDMYFKPLSFVYADDKMAVQVEDQLMIGNEIMIAPVYTQNARGRYVYLPENMKLIKFMPDGSIYQKEMEKGHHYVEIDLNQVALFIRNGKCIPVARPAEYVDAINYNNIYMLGYEGSEYMLYNDDGVSKDYENPDNYKKLTM